MPFNFIDNTEKENIIPILLKDKEIYFWDLEKLKDNWTGRLDAFYANTFFLESIQLIINAIVLFEKGYFDTAFYSLRQSLELSTTIVYLVDDSEEKREQAFNNWRKQEKFPGQAQMLKELLRRFGDFSDIAERISSYFSEVELIKQKLNKYVHKQGFNKFYVSRNHPLYRNKEKEEKLLKDFEEYLVKSIGTVAIFRLVIDPFPVLLMDEAIYNRTGDLITGGYTEEFIDKYIGKSYVDEYRKSNLYRGYYEEIMRAEEKHPAVVSLVKDQYIDENKIDEIFSQRHLLSLNDLVAINLVKYSKKVVKVYCTGGLRWYFTNRNSNRKRMSWSSTDFTTERVNFNTPYDEVFLTHFKAGDEDYFIEHNESFTPSEFNKLEQKLSKLK